MNKTFATGVAALAAVVLFASPVVAQRGPRGGAAGGGQPGRTGAPGAAATSPLGTYVASLPLETLSAAESASIAYMREEEKLARDVYDVLWATWRVGAFARIAQAEQQHMDEVKLLVDRYGIEDPAATTKPGEFKDARLAALYASLVEKGKASVADALQVGATIEDVDLSDLKRELAAADNRDVKAVFQNLAKGSRNHLRAFSAQLAVNGSSYAAQYLSQAEVDAIVAAAHERRVVYDENGQALAGAAGTCTGAGRGGRGSGGRGGWGRGMGAGAGAGYGPGDGTGPNCPR